MENGTTQQFVILQSSFGSKRTELLIRLIFGKEAKILRPKERIVRVSRRGRRKREPLVRPRFMNYMAVSRELYEECRPNMDLHEGLRPLLDSRSGEPVRLSKSRLMGLCEEGELEVTLEGRAVLFFDGPFSGLEGVVRGDHVEVVIFGRKSKVKVDNYTLKPL